jgi:hypothetical protein
MKKKITLKSGWFLEYYQEGSSFTGFLTSMFGHWIPVKGAVKGKTFTVQYQVFEEEQEYVVEALPKTKF